MGARPYLKLTLILAAGLAVVLFVCHAKVAEAAHIRFAPHHLYLALMAMSPLGILLLFVLGEVFRNRRLNMVLAGVFALVFTGAFIGQRSQAGVGDDEALSALIGHQSHTIHLCEQARLRDPRVIALCDRLTTHHRRDLAFMHGLLAEG